MIFIILNKLRKKPTKKTVAEVNKRREKWAKDGVKFLGSYWTLGSYDTVWIIEAPNVKAAMKATIRARDILTSETLVAISRDEAIKLVE